MNAAAFSQLAQKLEAVHFRHHQVEQDQAWDRMVGEPVQSAAAVDRLMGHISHALQRMTEYFAGRLVVFHHQDRSAGGTGAMLAQDRRQALPIYWFSYEIGGTQRDRHAALVEYRHHDHRDVAQRGVGLELLERAPAVHLRHQYVERDRLRPVLARE